MATRSVLGFLAALLFASTWVTPSGVAGDWRSPALNAATPPVQATPATLQTLVPQQTILRGAPGFKIVPAAQFAESTPRSKVARPTFRGGASRKTRASSPLSAPGATHRTPTTIATVTSPRIALYNNLNSTGITAAANAFGETPPDSTGAIGPNHYVEMVNSQIGVWSRSNLVSGNGTSLEAFVGANPGTPYCDPQVQWDPTAGRWLYAFLFCNTSTSAQDVHFGWSKTSDPSDLVSGWCNFYVQTDPFILDYPKLGHSSKFLIVGGNFYDESTPSTNPPFVTAAMFWVPKPAKGNTICSLPASFGHTTANPLKNSDGVTRAFTPVPVNTMTASTNGYIVSASDPSGSNGQAPATRHRLAVWHLDSSGVLHQHSDITVANYTFPSPAPQLGSAFQLDTLDARLTQAAGDPATGIWTQHTVDGPGGRSVVRWYEIKVAGSTASLAQQGDIASATDWVFNGAISPRFDALGAAVFYNRSSFTIDPVIAGQDRLSSTALGAMEPGEFVLASSTAADTDGSCPGGFPCRWGDYSAASPDPVQTNVVWGTNQFNSSTGSTPAWKTQNFAVLFFETPANVAATAGDQSAAVRWTAPFDPGTPITTFTINVYVGVGIVKSIDVPGSARNAIVSGLTNGVTYTLTVIAHSIWIRVTQTTKYRKTPTKTHTSATTGRRYTQTHHTEKTPETRTQRGAERPQTTRPQRPTRHPAGGLEPQRWRSTGQNNAQRSERRGNNCANRRKIRPIFSRSPSRHTKNGAIPLCQLRGTLPAFAATPSATVVTTGGQKRTRPVKRHRRTNTRAPPIEGNIPPPTRPENTASSRKSPRTAPTDDPGARSQPNTAIIATHRRSPTWWYSRSRDHTEQSHCYSTALSSRFRSDAAFAAVGRHLRSQTSSNALHHALSDQSRQGRPATLRRRPAVEETRLNDIRRRARSPEDVC